MDDPIDLAAVRAAREASDLRAERDGFVRVWRKRTSRVAVLADGGDR